MTKKDGALQAKIEYLNLLLKISGALATLHDSKTLFQKITDYSVELLKLGSSAIYVLDGEELRLEATCPSLPPKFPEEFRVATLEDHPHIQKAITSRKSVILADTQTANLTHAEKTVCEMRGLRSLLYQPLVYKGKPLGVLIIGSVNEAHEFTADEVSVCQSLANLAALQITEARQFKANQEFIDLLEYQRIVANHAYNMIYLRSPDGALLYMSPSCERITGYSYKEYLDSPDLLEKIVHPEDRSFVQKRKTSALGKNRRGKIHLAEFRILHKNGETRWLHHVCEMITNQRGEIIGRRAINSDISAQKRAEETLINSEARVRFLIENAPAGIFVQTNHKFAFVNPAAVRLFGARKPEDLLGTPVLERFHPDFHAIVKGRIQNLNVGKTSVPAIEEVYLRMDGANFDVEVNAVPIHWEGKDGALVFFRDISERKQAEAELTDEANRRRLLMEQSRDGIVILDQDGRVYESNRKFAEMLGYPLESMSRLNVRDWEFLFPPERVMEMIRSIDEKGDHFETRHRRRDGSTYDVEISTNAAWFGGQKLVLCICRDITERKQAEAALQQSNERTHAILNAASESVFLMDLDGRVLDTNETAAQRFGKSAADLTGANIYDLLPPELAEIRKEKVQEVVRESKPQRFEDRQADRWFEHSIYPVVDSQGNVTGVAVYMQDITDRRLAEDALKEREERFRRLAENAQDLIYRVRLSEPRGFEYVNPSATAITGYTPEELYEDPDMRTKLAHPDDRPLTEAIAAGEADLTQPLVLRWVRKDGEEIWTEQRNVPIFDSEGKLVAMEGIARDITERKRSLEAEKALARRIEAGLRAGNLAWWEMELPSGKVRFDDRKAEMLGYDPGRFKTYRDFTRLLHPEDKPTANQAMQDHLDGKKETYEVEYRIRTSNGSYKWLRDIGAITERDLESGTTLVMGIVDDISQRKEAELALEAYSGRLEEQVAERTRALEETQKELIEKEKLATLGQLAGGVGHELRNPLGVISNAVYILKATVAQENEKAREYADMIGEQVQRSNKIISDLLNFAREPSASRSEIDVSALVARVLADFPPPEGVRVRKTIAKGQPKALADAQHAEQILANLISNSYQAMPEGGHVSVSASRKQGKVRIAVRDNGAGISKENLEKLFVPLFTTKAKGIGLGLATSKKLAEVNGGRIEVKSQEGKGSTFTLVLPATEIFEGRRF